ncbi:hypothetical protein DY000_02017347 [Brassica cretica]|uniref:Uncharacterized protein n=1 Tax=Brassica cretica TaxID=69181 RepID=A0ABQ7D3T1_BRACR|nr:hypothetical protein DY000_02017347 [Brassica cretica]
MDLLSAILTRSGFGFCCCGSSVDTNKLSNNKNETVFDGKHRNGTVFRTKAGELYA